MKRTGAQLARFALEQLGVTHTFGIPGVHTTELYDQLNQSQSITPVLVADERGGGYMADAISRTGDSIGTLMVVPAAGITHAASAIGEASLAGIPMLVVSGGIHSESGQRYQLHDIDQQALLKPITKGTWKVQTHADVIPMLYDAYRTAVRGEPGPVLVEIPYNISNFRGAVDAMPAFTQGTDLAALPDREGLKRAARRLLEAKHPGLFVGWGSLPARAELIELAELLQAPVCTTLQGLSAFPGNHPLHVGMGFGGYAVPAARAAFADCDCLLAVGTRFAQIPTGSYSMPVPDELIHVDINREVFNANYRASVRLQGDSAMVVPALLQAVREQLAEPRSDGPAVQIAESKAAYLDEWRRHDSQGRVNPASFITELRQQMDDEAVLAADDGNHTYLLAELMPIHAARGFICPTDFNSMGYCVPGAIGAKLADPARQVIGVVGDGALRMTGLEMITASNLGLGVAMFVFSDGELSQISQAQQAPYGHKTCTRLKALDIEALAQATDCAFLRIDSDDDNADVIAQALELAASGRPVLVDVAIDYSKPTCFTQGVMKATVKSFATRDKVHVIGRALWRRLRNKRH